MKLFIDFNGIVCGNYDKMKFEKIKFHRKHKRYCLVRKECKIFELTKFGWSPVKVIGYDF